MEWYVYRCDTNRDKIEKFNVFRHHTFRNYIRRHLRTYEDKEAFAKQLRSELIYYFWSKSEYELIIEITKDNRIFLNPWLRCRNPEEVRIDVTDNTDFDWRSFAEEHIKQQVYDNEAKIDIYDQVMFDWDAFLDYVWDNKDELLSESEDK